MFGFADLVCGLAYYGFWPECFAGSYSECSTCANAREHVRRWLVNQAEALGVKDESKGQ